MGHSFEQLRYMIDRVEDESRVGVCLDTCHMFAAGYDLATPAAYAATMRRFDDVVGLPFLKGILPSLCLIAVLVADCIQCCPGRPLAYSTAAGICFDLLTRPFSSMCTVAHVPTSVYPVGLCSVSGTSRQVIEC